MKANELMIGNLITSKAWFGLHAISGIKKNIERVYISI